MKKWTLHKIACIVNAITATTIVLIILHDILNVSNSFTRSDLLPFLILFFCYFTYMMADYWGMKLFYRYDKGEEISNKHYRIIYTILVFLGIVLFATGFSFSQELNHLIFIIGSIFRVHMTIYDFMDLMVVTVFITALILFITTILLLRAAKKRNLDVKSEIDEIGSNATIN